MSLEKEQVEEEKGDDDDGIVKRKGKRRKKRGRDLSGGPASLQQPADPETQVSTIAPESQNVSARPSLVPQEAAYEGLESFAKVSPRLFAKQNLNKYLRRKEHQVKGFLANSTTSRT